MKSFDSIESLPEDSIKSIQNSLLVETVRYAYQNSTYYKRKFDNLRLNPDEITGIKDLEKLSLTDRRDIQGDNAAFFAIGNSDIAEIVSTTGTTGNPIFISLTNNDLDRLARNEERSFAYTGANKDDLFHLAVTCDNLFIAGIAYYSGLRRTGASVVRIGPQNIIRHLDLIKKLRPTGIVAVPSFLTHLVGRATDSGIDVKSFGLKKLVLIGDSIRDADFKNNSLGQAIENYFGDICFSTYGITEAQVSFCECSMRQGLHSHPDFVIVEIIDDKGNALPDGEIGELVLTPLQISGMPLIRYMTGDITFKISTPCACGRNSVRIGSILGRKHQRLKVKGVTLYPKTIENAIVGIKDIINYQIEAYTDKDGTDNILLRIGSHNASKNFSTELRDMLIAKARVTPMIEIEPPESIEKRLFENGSRKAVTFKDRRVGLHE
jgi:phenylacetate-CoA ligase